MPIAYEIDHALRTVFTRASGVLTKSDMFVYQKELLARDDARLDDECIDMTAVTEIGMRRM